MEGAKTMMERAKYAIFGSHEKFTNYVNWQTATTTGITFLIGWCVIAFVPWLLFCWGAARLSYCYNVYMGNVGSAALWAILCFLFPGFYYPLYAVMLNPVCNMARGPMGGRK